jgi:hypothetical protein
VSHVIKKKPKKSLLLLNYNLKIFFMFQSFEFYLKEIQNIQEKGTELIGLLVEKIKTYQNENENVNCDVLLRPICNEEMKNENDLQIHFELKHFKMQEVCTPPKIHQKIHQKRKERIEKIFDEIIPAAQQEEKNFTKKFKCQKCFKMYVHKYSLNRHYNIHHDKIRRYECSICFKDFYALWEMKRHTRRSRCTSDQ